MVLSPENSADKAELTLYRAEQVDFPLSIEAGGMTPPGLPCYPPALGCPSVPVNVVVVVVVPV
jgi:hypothetical protein